LKAFVDTNTVATASSNYNLTYNDKTGEIMKRPVFDINYPIISACAQFGNPPVNRASISAFEAAKFPLRVNEIITGQDIDWEYYARLSQNDYSGTNVSVADHEDGMLVYVDGRILATTGFYVANYVFYALSTTKIQYLEEI
jgi:hypothetical protein